MCWSIIDDGVTGFDVDNEEQEDLVYKNNELEVELKKVKDDNQRILTELNNKQIEVGDLQFRVQFLHENFKKMNSEKKKPFSVPIKKEPEL